MRVLTSEQMREADRRAIEDLGIPAAVLMENAGRQVVAAMEGAFEIDEAAVAVLCGRGNNGGDGFVVARTLFQRGVEVSVFLVGEAAAVRGDARRNLDSLAALGLDVVEIADAGAWELHGSDVLGADLIVDALFGTGLSAPLDGLAETIVADVNACPAPVVAIDLPSGLSADRVDPPGPAIEATLTVALAAPKLPLVLSPGEAFTGDLVIADIGIPLSTIEELDGPWIELITRDSVRPLIEPRARDSHKGDYGRLLVVAGSRGRAGAASLTAMAALRSGAGLVTVATPASSLPVVAALGAEYMTSPLDETPEGTVAPDAIESVLLFGADVIAVGPGLGRSPGAAAFVQALVERAGVPLVLDADALYAFGDDPGRLTGRDGVDVIITPHPGEMARLTGLSIEEVQANRLDVARDFATTHRLTVILKGHRTIVATPDGKTFVNRTGNPGMATAGSGDVLTGMVAAWAAQLLDAEAAAKLAVFLHGLAGDLAEADEGEVALIASDIVSHLGEAVLDLTARKRRQGPPAS
ncbi:MAG TPA: NAD(P)H-hydrate dehydratase [Vicinamibacterales bacterium]|nr:NAD(P)H-hydrate dehydratase [Vicinamibacterales bacterium]